MCGLHINGMLSRSSALNSEYLATLAAQLRLHCSGMTATFTVLGFIMILATMCTSMASPPSPSARETAAAESREIKGLRAQKAAQSRDARTERFASLPEDQRQFMSKQILQALSEIIQRDDCISDYQGWVDFGRRSTD